MTDPLESMDLTMAAMTEGLVREILDLVHQYDEAILLPTTLGCLDVVKHMLLMQATVQGPVVIGRLVKDDGLDEGDD